MLSSLILGVPARAQDQDPAVDTSFRWPHIVDLMRPDLGLPVLPGATYQTLYQADGTTPEHHGAYSHHAHLAFHAGHLYAMWSNHLQDEDAPGQRVFLRHSTTQGRTWTPDIQDPPRELFPQLDRWGYAVDEADGSRRTGTANGFVVTDPDHALYALNEVLPDIRMQGQGLGRLARRISEDGSFGPIFWVRGHSPSTPNGFPEYPDLADPAFAGLGTAILAATKDASRGQLPTWDFAGGGNTTTELRLPPSIPEDGHRLCEPTRAVSGLDGHRYQFWRDLGKDGDRSHRLYVATSTDQGRTWSKPVRTAIPDAGSRPWAGNLPDGRVCLIHNPGGFKGPGSRLTLTLSLSVDGRTFDRAFVIRGNDTSQRFLGRYKGAGFAYPFACIAGDDLFILYSVNKEDMELCRIPLATLL